MASLALMLPVPGALAQSEVAPSATTLKAARVWIPALLNDRGRFAALDEMRERPELARQVLLLALQQAEPGKDRVRLAWHMAEFGRVEDIPGLLGLLAGEHLPEEVARIEGAARGLYPVYSLDADPMPDLTLAVSEFIFIQTKSPTPFDTSRANTMALTSHSFRMFHRENLPGTVIAKLQGLRDKPFKDMGALAAAIQKRVKAREWRLLERELLNQAEMIPTRASVSGLLRVQVTNSMERPLMLRIDFDAWNGTFHPAPKAGWLYIAPGERGRYDQKVRIVGPMSEVPMRVDLSLREVHHPPAQLYRKVFIYLLTE